MLYEVWIADLNSLYDENPRVPVFHKVFAYKEQAEKEVQEIRDHETAAWIQMEPFPCN